MNLRGVRMRLTAAYTALTAIAVIVLAVVANRWGTERLYDSAERDAERVVADVMAEDFWEEGYEARNVWIVRPLDESFDDLGPTDVEPPLFTIAGDAYPNRPAFTRFEQGGTWLTYARQLNESEVMVAAIDLDDVQSSASSLTWRLVLASAGVVLLAGVGGWHLVGRSLAPARLALQQQRDFIADAAHELRTPLSVIQASASHALSREREAWEYERSLLEIRTAAERAGAGVGELLELARLESGQALPRLAPLRLDLLAEEVAAASHHDGVSIMSTIGAPVIVNADYNLLRQALNNLVSNAAARATHVCLAVRPEETAAVIEVTDNGPGFDPAVLPTVFKRFGRGDEKGSHGLGMAIVETIVSAHSGSCEAANRTPTMVLDDTSPTGDEKHGGAATDEEHQAGAVVTIRLPLAG